MKKILATITASLLVAGGVLYATPAAYAAPVDGIDPNLQACINETLNREANTTVQTEDIENLTGDLNCSNRNITSLEGLQYATNLITVNFNSNKVSDVTPLSNLTNLFEVRLSDNNISDVTPLSNVVADFFYLDISDNKVFDISSLSLIGQNITNDDFIGSQFVSSPTLFAGGQYIEKNTSFGFPYLFDLPRNQGDFTFNEGLTVPSWNGVAGDGFENYIPNYLQNNDGVVIDPVTGSVTILNLGSGGDVVSVKSSIDGAATESGNASFPYAEIPNLTAFGQPLRTQVLWDTTSTFILEDQHYLWTDESSSTGGVRQLFDVTVPANSKVSQEALVRNLTVPTNVTTQVCSNPTITSVVYNGTDVVDDFSSFVYLEGSNVVFDSSNGLKPIYPVFGYDSYNVDVNCFDAAGSSYNILATVNFAFEDVVEAETALRWNDNTVVKDVTVNEGVSTSEDFTLFAFENDVVNTGSQTVCVTPNAEYNNGSGWGALPEWASVSGNTIFVSSNAPVTQEGQFNSFRIICGDSGVNASQNLITLNVVIVADNVVTPPVVDPPVVVEPPVIVDPPSTIKNGGADVEPFVLFGLGLMLLTVGAGGALYARKKAII